MFLAKTCQILKDVTGLEEVEPGTPLNGLGLDSLDALDLLFQLEQSLRLSVAEEELSGLKTVLDLALLLRRKSSLSPRAVFYHDECSDGFCAAWLFAQVWPDAEYVPSRYGSASCPQVAGLDVVLVDFSYPRACLEAMQKQASRLTVLDHHWTAHQDLHDLPFCHFDMDKSGARLAWEWLWDHDGLSSAPLVRQSGSSRDHPHWLVAYTEDRDLWKHELPYSHAVNAWISMTPATFSAWDELAKSSPGEVAVLGATVRRCLDQLVEEHVRQASPLTLDGHKGLGVNCSVRRLASEVAGALAASADFGLVWQQQKDGSLSVSLRSRLDGLDVASLARQFGGGGHRHAAGFRVPSGATPPWAASAAEALLASV